MSAKPTAIHAPAEPFAETATQSLDTAPLNRILQKHLHDGRLDFVALQKDAAALFVADDVPIVEQPYDWKLGAHTE